MPLIKEPDTEPIPGYRLVEVLGRGGFGEVWKCEAPGGLFKAVKFVSGDLHSLNVEELPAEQEWKALQLVKTIRHPFLLGIDRLEVVGGELVVVMELADRSLADAFRECREAGLVGIPRPELLSYLREAAEALDVINLHHHLQHLDVKPANLFLVNRHVKVGDFGLLSRRCDTKEATADTRLGGLTPLYCAFETLQGIVSGRSDQYSLAVVYQELLTGKLPFVGRNQRELLIRRATGDPDLSALPKTDRPIVARALARDPEARYPSCTEFVRALAPELMPLNSSPFLDVLLTDGTAAAPTRTAGSRSRLSHATVLPPTAKTQPHTLRSAPHDAPKSPADASDFAGHRLIECLGRSPLCETWMAQSPDGRARVLKFPNGLTNGHDPAEAAILRFLCGEVHPHLQPIAVLRNGNRIALICDPPGRTLADRLQQCQAAGLPGLPRRELLDHLHVAAQALDAVYHEHGLQHLCLTPRSFLLNDERLLIADMGPGQLLWLPAGHPLGQFNGRYAAPELWAGDFSPTCDQYSLAVIYQELLTGTWPFRGKPGRGQVRPNLDLLPASDREPIARALNPNPERRFSTCVELIDALDRSAMTATRRASVLLPPVISVSGSAPAPTSADSLPPPTNLIGQMLEQAAGGFQVRQVDGLGYILDPCRQLTHTCGAYLSASLARLKLEGFQQQWRANLTYCKAGVFVLEVPLSGSIWQRCLDRQPCLEIRISVGSPQGTHMALTAVCITIRPLRCGTKQAGAALEQHGLRLLHDLRTFLQVEPERQAQHRLPFEHPLGLFPILDEQQLGDGLVCQGKDLSLGGIGLLAPAAPSADHLYVQSLLTPQLATVALLGRVVRVLPRADGWYEIGAAFVEGPEAFVAARAGVRSSRMPS